MERSQIARIKLIYQAPEICNYAATEEEEEEEEEAVKYLHYEDPTWRKRV